ncbi:MAG TPA: helix-turn-helix domain-containing protein [Steroidobacteraceae bacterium]|jgi:AcrR family transcriptional regulator|nr:helix-turn-helix domain-containing protein [Steroidobacteraceae bacterium]
MATIQRLRRKTNGDAALSRQLILDTTERLMREEGYAAVSTRRVASEAGLKPPLVHYYYRTTDDLLLAAYARTAEQMFDRLDIALASDDPIQALWMLNTDRDRTTLTVEFMALANHRKSIRNELARNIERFRRRQAEVLAQVAGRRVKPSGTAPPVGIAMMLAGISRGLVMERALGVSLGHDEAEQFVAWWMNSVRPAPRRRRRVARSA